MIEFSPITWSNGQPPTIDAANLNRYETVLEDLTGYVNGFNDMKTWTQHSFPYNKPFNWGYIIGFDNGVGGDSYFIAVSSDRQFYFGTRVNQETEITWKRTGGGVRFVVVDYGTVTVPSNGYITLENTPQGRPELAEGESFVGATIFNWNSITPVATINVTDQYVMAAPNTTITHLRIRFQILLS